VRILKEDGEFEFVYADVEKSPYMALEQLTNEELSAVNKTISTILLDRNANNKNVTKSELEQDSEEPTVPLELRGDPSILPPSGTTAKKTRTK